MIFSVAGTLKLKHEFFQHTMCTGTIFILDTSRKSRLKK
jgi:hypothetical protein